MSTTRKDLRQRIGGMGFCNDTTVTAATSGSDSTKIVDNTLTFPNDAINFGWVAIISGSASGDRRQITDWTLSTYTLTPDRNFTAAVSSGDGVEIHRQFSPDRKDAAIDEAIRASDRRFARKVEDESITISAATFAYALNSLSVALDRLHGLDRVEYATGASGTGPPWQPYKPDWWNMRDNNGALTLQFTRLPVSSQKIRLTYRVRPPTLSADSSALDPDDTAFAEFICTKAAGLLFDEKAQLGDERQSDPNEQTANIFQAYAERWLAPTGELMLPKKKE